MGFLHLLPISTSLARDFKPTDTPHQFKLKILTGGHNAAPDRKAAEKAEEFRRANDYLSANVTARRFNFLPSFYEYTVQFEPRLQLEPATNLRPRMVSFSDDLTTESLGPALRQGNWQAIEQFLLSIADSQLRDFYVSAVAAEVGEDFLWLDEWVKERPGQYLPLLFRGDFKVHWAWRARGGRRAAYVADEQFKVFFARLEMARQDLEAAAALAPADEAGAFAFMIPMAMGLQWPKDAVLQIYHEAQRRRPWHQLVHVSMVQVLAPKWSGSLEEMFALARSTSAAPIGSGASIAIFHAHAEASHESGSPDYWKDPAILPEVLAAARRTVWAAGAYETPLTLAIHRSLLYCLIRLDDAEHACREFDAVNGRLGYPITYMKDPVAGYAYSYKKANGLLPPEPTAPGAPGSR